MKSILKLIFLSILALSSTGCAKLWPYKSDFDCPIPKGEHCKSLYEINIMADQGKFSPPSKKRPKDYQLICYGNCVNCRKK